MATKETTPKIIVKTTCFLLKIKARRFENFLTKPNEPMSSETSNIAGMTVEYESVAST
jgi:hypothetical protein